MADFQLDPVTAKEVADAVAAVAAPQAKQAAFASVIAARFSQNASMLLTKGSQSLAIQIPEPGKVSGGEFVYPAFSAAVSVSSGVDLDDDWGAQIRDVSGQRYIQVITRPAIGRGSPSVVRIEGGNTGGADLTGLHAIAIGPIRVSMPTYGAPSAPPPSVPIGNYVEKAPPGQGWSILLKASDTPIQIPEKFVGQTRDAFLGVSPYPYRVTRSHGIDAFGQDTAGLLLFQLNPQPGQFVRDGIDAWIASTPNCLRIFNLGDWAKWTAKYDDARGPWDQSKSTPSAVKNVQIIKDFLKWLYSVYTPAQIPVIEVRNEPNFGPSHQLGSRYGPTGDTVFFNGTAYDLRDECIAAKASVPPGVKVIGPAFAFETNFFDSNIHFRNFAAAGGLTPLDGVSYHGYMYSNNPKALKDIGKPLRDWLDANGYRDKTIWMTEKGHEAGGDARNLSDEAVQAAHIRSTLYDAFCRAQCSIAFKDANRMLNVMRNPTASAVIQQGFRILDAMNGNLMRQLAEHPDGRVWARFQDGLEIVR